MATGPAPSSGGRARLGRWAVPVVAVGIAVAAVAVVAARDGDEGAAASAASRSSTIAWAADGEHLWLTSPDDDRVVEVDADTLATGRQIAVEGQPQELAVLDDRLLVTGAQRTSLAVVDAGVAGGAETEAEAAEVELPCSAPRGVVGVPAGTTSAEEASDLAVVTCPLDDLLVVVDVDELAARSALAVPGRPTGIAHDGDELAVTTAGDGTLHRFALADVLAATDGDAPAPRSTQAAWTDGERTASLLGPVDLGALGPVAGYQSVDNERPLTDEEVEADATYGELVGGRARLEPALAGPCGARFADFEAPAQRLSLPVALDASDGGRTVWVVGQSSRSVSVVRCAPGDPAAPSTTVAAFDVGDGPRGIALAPDGRTAFVDVGFDHEVARLELPAELDPAEAGPADARLAPAATGGREVDGYLSPLAAEGRSMFHDATDAHLSPFGVASCASCHPGAGDDAMRWRIETQAIPEKLRRTPPVWAVDPEAKPLHWDGEYDSTDDLALDTIRELLGGDGLLVDTAAITAYLAEVPAPPSRSIAPAGAGSGDAAVGRELFGPSGLGCASCHAGELGTDGRAHDVLAPTGDGAVDLDGAITPTLVATRGRAPYGHDGRAATLDDLLLEHLDADGERIRTTAEQRADLLAYLATR